jgi:uncharacterized protein YkwD
MLTLVNEQRAQGATCGGERRAPTHALTLNAQLSEAALLHALDMGEGAYFDHSSRDGRTPWDRIEATGYAGYAYGENIAAGAEGADETYAQWLSSPGHCANMLSADFTELGVGYAAVAGSPYTHYWVQTFGGR